MAIKLINKIPEPSEHEMQCALFEILKVYEDRIPEWKAIYAIPNGAKLPYKKSAKGRRYSNEAIWMLKEGMKPGTPDICCPFRAGVHSALYIEMKKPGNKLSPLQIERGNLLTFLGNEHTLAYSVESAFEDIRLYTLMRYEEDLNTAMCKLIKAIKI